MEKKDEKVTKIDEIKAGETTGTDITIEEKKPWYKKPITWVIAGATAIASAVLIAVFGKDDDDSGDDSSSDDSAESTDE